MQESSQTDLAVAKIVNLTWFRKMMELVPAPHVGLDMRQTLTMMAVTRVHPVNSVMVQEIVSSALLELLLLLLHQLPVRLVLLDTRPTPTCKIVSHANLDFIRTYGTGTVKNAHMGLIPIIQEPFCAKNAGAVSKQSVTALPAEHATLDITLMVQVNVNSVKQTKSVLILVLVSAFLVV